MKKSRLAIILFSLFMPTLLLCNVSRARDLSDFTSKTKDITLISQTQLKPRTGYKLSPSNYSWSFFPVPAVSRTFTKEQAQLIWSSLAIANDFIKNDEVLGCIKKYSTSGYRSLTPDKMVRGIGFFASAHPKFRLGYGRDRKGLQYLYIHKMDEEGTTLGQARTIEPMNQDLQITLNSYNLSRHKDPYKWAGVIIHEILHNWSYDHPVVTNGDFSSIPGNFVYEAGWCFERQGAYKVPGSLGLDGVVTPGIGGVIPD